MLTKIRSHYLTGALVLGGLLLVSAYAQDGKKQDTANDTEKKDDAKQDADKADAAKADAAKADTAKADDGTKPAAKAFRAQFDQWRSMLKKLAEIRKRYDGAKKEDVPAIEKEWADTIAAGEKLIPQMRDSALKAYVESPNRDRELTRFLIRLTEDALRQDLFETTKKMAETMIANDVPDKNVWNLAGVACFGMHDFDKSVEYLTKAKEFNVINQSSEMFLQNAKEYVELWKKEKEIRKEQEGKNNPQVKLTTTKGDITVELFEDDAPGAVANFINLVESGFYADKTFHRVLPGFMAQGGCPKGDGTGGPGYTIYCECDPKEYPDYRRHFRGSLSMAHAGPNTGGSQFFMTFRPTPDLNGKHTCFGRVLSGWDVLAKLQRIDPEKPAPNIQPDKIVKAEVIRKRDHDYIINKVQ